MGAARWRPLEESDAPGLRESGGRGAPGEMRAGRSGPPLDVGTSRRNCHAACAGAPLAGAPMRPRLLLFYNHYWEIDPAARIAPGFVEGWTITSDSARIDEADAVVFHVPDVRAWPAAKRPGQTWVGWSAESDISYPQLRYAPFMARFDLTMTYRLDADVPVLYVDPWIHGQLRRSPVE